jgi:DNA-binding CsgD family transcriptional regulator
MKISRRSIRRRLTSRQLHCAALYCYDGLTLPAIGRSLGISRQMAGRHVETALRKLKAFRAAVRTSTHFVTELPGPEFLESLDEAQIRGLW